MGSQMTVQQIATTSIANSEKLAEKKANLSKQIEKRLFVQGTEYTGGEKLLSLSVNENIDIITDGITGLVGKNSVKSATFLFKTIANQLKELLVKTNSNNLKLYEFRAYPLAFRVGQEFGLAIAYFNLQLEKLPTAQGQIVMVCAFKIVGVPNFKKQQEINKFLLSSAIVDQGDRQKIKSDILSSIKVS